MALILAPFFMGSVLQIFCSFHFYIISFLKLIKHSVCFDFHFGVIGIRQLNNF